MATPTVAKNKSRTMKKILMLLQKTSGGDIGLGVGAATMKRIETSLWVCAGAPSGAAPTGMTAGDLILDTTNSAVYRYITGTTYVQVDATS